MEATIARDQSKPWQAGHRWSLSNLCLNMDFSLPELVPWILAPVGFEKSEHLKMSAEFPGFRPQIHPLLLRSSSSPVSMSSKTPFTAPCSVSSAFSFVAGPALRTDLVTVREPAVIPVNTSSDRSDQLRQARTKKITTALDGFAFSTCFHRRQQNGLCYVHLQSVV